MTGAEISKDQICGDIFPLKTEPLDQEDFDEDAHVPKGIPEYADFTEFVKVELDNEDLEYFRLDPGKTKQTTSSSRGKKASETALEKRVTGRDEEIVKKRKSRTCESDDDDPEFNPGRISGKKRKPKTVHAPPLKIRLRQRKSATIDHDDKDLNVRQKRIRTVRRKKASEKTPEEIKEMRERWRLERQKERARLSEEALQRRRAIDRERKRMKRASEPRRSGPTSRRKKASEMTPEELAANREKWRKEKQAQRKQQELAGLKPQLNPEKRQVRNQRRKEHRQNLSKEGRALLHEKEKQRREFEKTVRAKLRKGEPLDPKMTQLAEKIKERAQKEKLKRLQRLAEMTDEERRQKRMNRYMQHVARMAKLTPEQKEAERKKMREYIKAKRAKMSQEEKKKLVKRYNAQKIENGMTKRQYLKLRMEERLKAEGKWEEHLEQQKAKQKERLLKRRKNEIKRVTIDKLGRTITRSFETPEDEARFREMRRICGIKGALKKKLVASGAAPEDIERQLLEFAKANQHILPLVPKRRSSKRETITLLMSRTEFECRTSVQAQIQPPASITAAPQTQTIETNCHKINENSSTNLSASYNPFMTRWATAEPTVYASTPSVYNHSYPTPPPAHQPFPVFPSVSLATQKNYPQDHIQEELKDFAVCPATSLPHHEREYNDSISGGSVAYSPSPCTPETLSTAIPAPPSSEYPTNQASPPAELSRVNIPPPRTEPKRQTRGRRQRTENHPEKPLRSRSPINTMPVPIVPSRTDYVDNQTSGNDNPKNPEFQRRKRILYQSLKPTKFEKNLKCSFCGNFYAKNVYRYHVNGMHHPYYKGGLCTICGTRHKQARDFHKHFRNVHGGTGDVRKGNITYIYPTPPPPPAALEETHIVNSEPDPSAQEILAPRLVRNSICDICGGSYPHYSLAAHKAQQHPPHYVNGACALCGEKFPKSAAAFRRHYKEVHVGKDVPVAPKYSSRSGDWVCEECGSKCMDKFLLSQHKYYMHGAGARVENFPQCHVCPDKPRFKRRDYLQKHFKRHHPDTEVPGPFKCPAHRQGCKLTFFLESMIRDHMGEKHPKQRFECQFCGTVKFSELSLNFHYTVKRCLKAPRKEFEKILERIGDNSVDRMKLECELCKAEVNLSALKAHYQVSHKAKEEPFPCNDCGRKFLGREFLAVHLIDLHGMMPVEWKESLRNLNLTDRSGISVEPIISSERKRGPAKGFRRKSKCIKESKSKPTPARKSGQTRKKRVEVTSEEDELGKDEETQPGSCSESLVEVKQEEEDSLLMKIQEKDAEGNTIEKVVTFKELQDSWFSQSVEMKESGEDNVDF